MGTNAVSCTALDAAGNTAACSFNVIVVDSEVPVILVPTNSIVGNDMGQCSAVVRFEVHASDNMPGVLVACVPPSGSTFPLGTTIVRCTATDASGLTVSNSFLVTVRDTENPVLSLPADILVPCEPRRSTTDKPPTDSRGTTHPPGDDTRSRSGSKPPRGSNDPGQPAVIVKFTATATDNCGPASVTCTPHSGSSFLPGTNVVRCIAVDAAGNTASGTFQVITGDHTPPVIQSVTPSKRFLSPANGKMVTVSFVVAATDNCSAITYRISSISSSQSVGAAGRPTTGSRTEPDWEIVGPLRAKLRAERTPDTEPRIYTITIEAKDAAGNVSTASTIVHVPLSAPR